MQVRYKIDSNSPGQNQSRCRLDGLLADPAAPLALLILAWRPWLDGAIAQGTALPHFTAMAAMLGALAFKRTHGALILAFPPSPAALAAGWPATELVRVAYACLPDKATRKAAQRAARRLAHVPDMRARTLLIERRTPELTLLLDLLARDKPKVRCHSADEIESALPRARQLAKALRRTQKSATSPAGTSQASPCLSRRVPAKGGTRRVRP